MTAQTQYGPNQRGYATTFYWQALAVARQADVPRSNVLRGPGDLQFTEATAPCVILSAIALEAGINEVIAWHAAGFEGPSVLPSSFVEKRVRAKWRDLPRLVKGKSFDPATAPWLDFSLLIDLRNALAHFKWMERGSGGLVEGLRLRGLLLPHTDWLSAAMNNHVARWAVDTVAAMFAELTTLHDKQNREAWIWGPRGFPRRDCSP